jgi:cell division septation protein DedD
MQTSSRSFRIQVASFRGNKGASALIYKLENLGIPAQVQRVDIQGKGVYYRVYTKPYMKEQDAIQAKALIFKKLKLKGIMVSNG